MTTRITRYETGNFGGHIRRMSAAPLPATPTERKFRQSGCGFLVGIAATFLRLHPHPETAELECFARGVFDRSLAGKACIRLCYDHDLSTVKSTTADFLRLAANESCLGFVLNLDAIDDGEEIVKMVQTGERAEASARYRVESDRWHEIEGSKIRIIEDASLVEVSLCRKGACPGVGAAIVGGNGFDLPKAMQNGVLAHEVASARLARAFAALAAA